MARTNNLTNFLTDVASAIKTKTGDSTAIPASQFDTKIANITTGHLDNTEYEEANDDLDDILEGTTPMTIYPPDWSEIGYENTPASIIEAFNYAKEIQEDWDSSETNLSNKFSNNINLMYMPLVDTSNVLNMRYMFSGCAILQCVPLFDTSEVTNMYGMFSGCTILKNVPLFDTSEVTTMRNMFNNCSSLISVPQFNTDSMNTSTSFGGMFSYCNNLSNESLNNILAMCINATSYTGTKTLAYLGLSSTQATICQGLSNYQAFLNAGWTTGY